MTNIKEPAKNFKSQKKLLDVKVNKREDITDDLLKIWIEKPDGYVFKPGQYCTIGINDIERAYSIVSAPHESDLELFVELVPENEGGVLTPLIWDLGPGDIVTIRPRAKGIFVFNNEWNKHLLVATVTGVVPYVSFIRDYINKIENNEIESIVHEMHVLMGASYFDEFTYDEELKSAASKYPDLVRFVPTVSRPDEDKNASWTGATGRVNEIVEDYVTANGLSFEDTLIYACGHPGMIEDVKGKMAPLGFTVDEERFWKED
ncbi:MAG: ferredoxin--NADP(+) reductase [Dehalococcoidia bacterium]|nr:ferredoxin--NADP(+) reductase [Dehalococcoidia bacterium]MQG16028.1 ferredoxin--NADP reductase [SAR202 cluster bacterium]